MIKSKKGVTLVELIAAVAVIAIVVVGTVSGVVLAQQNILNDSLKEQASLKAQQVADTLVEKMSGKPYTDNYASAAAIPSSELEGPPTVCRRVISQIRGAMGKSSLQSMKWKRRTMPQA